MTIIIGADADDGPFADDMRLTSDLDLIAELADQAAQGAIINYVAEDWARSPLERMLKRAAMKMNQAGRRVPPAVIEAQERFAAAQAWVV